MNYKKLQKTLFSALFLSLIGSANFAQPNKNFHSWAPTPPMGWNSGLIIRSTPNQRVKVDINITGAQKLYLVVNDGDDKTDWDHTNWIEPIL